MGKKISLLKVLEFFFCLQIQVLAALTGAFSVSLFLLKVGMLGCVAMDIASPYWTVLWGIGSRCLSPVFP
jgi:hypothetical protein